MPPLPPKRVSSEEKSRTSGASWSLIRFVYPVSNGSQTIKREVSGAAYGPFVVHYDEDRSDWVLSLRETGSWIVRFRKEPLAKTMGVYLWSRFCLAFRGKTDVEVRTKLPSWFKGWVRRCMVEDRWIDPPE